MNTRPAVCTTKGSSRICHAMTCKSCSNHRKATDLPHLVPAQQSERCASRRPPCQPRPAAHAVHPSASSAACAAALPGRQGPALALVPAARGGTLLQYPRHPVHPLAPASHICIVKKKHCSSLKPRYTSVCNIVPTKHESMTVLRSDLTDDTHCMQCAHCCKYVGNFLSVLHSCKDCSSYQSKIWAVPHQHDIAKPPQFHELLADNQLTESQMPYSGEAICILLSIVQDDEARQKQTLTAFWRCESW